MMPARKRSATSTLMVPLTMIAYTIMGMLGGIRIPSEPAEVTSPRENCSS